MSSQMSMRERRKWWNCGTCTWWSMGMFNGNYCGVVGISLSSSKNIIVVYGVYVRSFDASISYTVKEMYWIMLLWKLILPNCDKQEGNRFKLNPEHLEIHFMSNISYVQSNLSSSPFLPQFHSRQPDESGHHALRWEPWCPHNPPQPLPQLPPASSQHARLQPGEHSHDRPCHGPSATDPRGAPGHRGGATGPDSGINRSLQRHRRHLHWG